MPTDRTIKEVLEEVVDEVIDNGIFYPELAAELEKTFITQALLRSQCRIQDAAELMGVHRNTLSKKIQAYGINRSALKLREASTGPKPRKKF